MEQTQDRIYETFMRRQLYKYYVYIQPGFIEYFKEYNEARNFADRFGVQVKELEWNYWKLLKNRTGLKQNADWNWVDPGLYFIMKN